MIDIEIQLTHSGLSRSFFYIFLEKKSKRSLCALKGKSMALRLPGYGHLMVQYIERAIAHGNIPGDMMADIGYLCLIGKEKGGRRYPPSPLIPAAKAAWRAGLQLMRSQREPPCMERFAKVTQATSHLLEINDRAGIKFPVCQVRTKTY